MTPHSIELLFNALQKLRFSVYDEEITKLRILVDFASRMCSLYVETHAEIVNLVRSTSAFMPQEYVEWLKEGHEYCRLASELLERMQRLVLEAYRRCRR